jgi:hypothetical protein
VGNVVPLADTLTFSIYGGSTELVTSARPRRWTALPGHALQEVR